MANEKVSLAALRKPASITKEQEPSPAEPHVRLTVDLPDSDHHFLKMLATESRMSMSDMMRGAVKLMREQQDMAVVVKQRARQL
jgi:hypothetical protein